MAKEPSNQTFGMRKYWDEIGRGGRANWHIAHIDDEREFYESGSSSANLIFDGTKIRNGSFVLDIGCGKGRVARSVALSRPDIRVFGVDVAPSMIETAWRDNAHISNLSFSVGDGSSLTSFTNGLFDYAYSYIVFQHLPRHVVGMYISEVSRILKPGGKLIFQVQSRTDPMPVDPPWDDYRSIRYYTPEQATALVRAPLKVERTRGGGHDFFVEASRG